LQDHYGAMWAHVAERFQNHPALLGYDLMNEPWQGSGLLHYKEFDETKYHAFNQRAIDAIRAVDADHWIFYEPCAFVANQAGPSFLPVLDDPREGENRLAYFPHFYPLLVDMLGGYRPDIDHSIDRWAELRLKESEKQQAPLLAGEWSMLRWFDDENRALFLDDTLRMLESATSGWAYWECSGFFGDANDEFRRLLTGPYPRRVAGAPVSYGFDEQTRVFELVFEDRPAIDGPTEIYLPATRDYPNGWGLLVSDPLGTWDSTWNAETQVLEIEINSGEPLHTIQIVPEDGK
jgi:endoglycosylceramidase